MEPEAEQTSLPRAALYVFVDKAQIKGMKVESHPKADFIPVEYPDTRKLRNSFKKLLRACHPSASQVTYSPLRLISLMSLGLLQ